MTRSDQHVRIVSFSPPPLWRWAVAAGLLLLLPTLLGTPTLDVRAQDAPNGDAPVDNRLTLFGTVTDAQEGTPLPGAHVFVGGTMIGTVTNADGEYRLANVPRGATRIHVSMIGFQPAVGNVFFRRSDEARYDVQLEPEVIESEGVIVQADRDEKWLKNVKRFKEMFLGPSQWSEDCDIVNPEVLRFERRWWGKFDVAAVEPLIIENHALGYRIEYHLHDFQEDQRILRWKGEPLFSEMVPSGPKEAARWKENRRTAYRGSMRHFLRSLIRGELMEEQFQVYRMPVAGERPDGYEGAQLMGMQREDILKKDQDSVFTLDFTGTIRVVYTGESESEAYVQFRNKGGGRQSVQASTIRMYDGATRVDRTGRLESPYAVVLDGYFAFHRSTAMLPVEYVPDGEPLFIGDEHIIQPRAADNHPVESRSASPSQTR